MVVIGCDGSFGGNRVVVIGCDGSFGGNRVVVIGCDVDELSTDCFGFFLLHMKIFWISTWSGARLLI